MRNIKKRIRQFTGMWYALSESGSQSQWTSKTWKFIWDNIGHTSLVFTGHSLRTDKCSPLTVYELVEFGQAGSYHMTEGDGEEPVHIKIVSTNYNYAVIHFCYYGDTMNDCGSEHVELWHRNTASLEELGNARSYAVDNLCLEDFWFKDLTRGTCKVPTLIANILKKTKTRSGYVSDQADDEDDDDDDDDDEEDDDEKDDEKDDDDDQDDDHYEKKDEDGEHDRCIVHDIIVQPDFKLEQMEGLWYEISRTRFTINNQESGVSYHKYLDDAISSLYTGTKDGECQSAIQGLSKRRSEQEADGDIVGRIGGPDSVFPWAPMKIVYADNMHMLFYACYNILSDGTCDKESEEVTLVGRFRDVGLDTTILSAKMLELCMQPTDMVPTEFEADCGDWVMKHDENEETEKEDMPECFVDGIKTASDFSTDKFLGKWYVTQTNIHAPFGRHAVTLNIYRGQGELLHLGVVLAIQHGNESCSADTGALSPSCGNDDGAFHLSPPKNPMMMFRQWVSFKVLYLTDTVMATYQCFKERTDGYCDKSGVIGYLLSRDRNVPIGEEDTLKELLQKSCLEVNNWKPVTDECDELSNSLSEVTDDRSPECQVFNIPSQPNLDSSRLEGIWYDIAFTPDPMFHADIAAMYYYKGAFEGSISNMKIGQGENGECQKPQEAHGRLRCPSNPQRGKMGRIIMPGLWTFAPMTILYSDYDKALVLYVCLEVDTGGHCVPEYRRIFILGRKQSLEPELRNHLNDVVRSACYDPDHLKNAEGSYGCTDTLENEVAKITGKDEGTGATTDVPECLVVDIKTASDFTTEKIFGKWYVRQVYSLGSMNQMIVSLTFRQGQGEQLHVHADLVLKHGPNNVSCVHADGPVIPACGSDVGDFIFSRPTRTALRQMEILKVLYLTDEVMATYGCVKEKSDGYCDKSGVRSLILTRDPSLQIPEEANLKEILRESCVGLNDWKSFSSDCAESTEDLTEMEDDKHPECRFMDIPVQQNYDPLKFLGLWYDVAITPDPIFNRNASVRYYTKGHFEGSWIAYQTGMNSEGQCEKPFGGMARPNCPSTYEFGLIGRILLPNMWSLMQIKLLYTDYDRAAAMYICMSLDSHGYCGPEYGKIFIMGRQPTLEPEERQKLDEVLRTACIDPNRLVDVHHTSDCSSALEAEVAKVEEEKNEVRECFVDGIKTAGDFTMDKFKGKWYVTQTNFYEPMGRHVATMDIYQGQGDLLHVGAVLSVGSNGSCISGDALLSSSCGSHVGDFHISPPNTEQFTFRQWTSLKVLYLTDTTMATYQCFKEDPSGNCDKSSVVGYILSRDPSVPIEREATLKELLKGSCLGVNNWNKVDKCNCYEVYTERISDDRSPDCQVMSIPAQQEGDLSRLVGKWYDIAYTPDMLVATRRSLIHYFTGGFFPGTMHMTTMGSSPSGVCENPAQILAQRRCPSNLGRGHMGQVVTPGWSAMAPVKILYADYYTAFVIYFCLDVDYGGHCTPGFQRLLMMGRNQTLEPDVREKLNDIVRSACIDPDQLVDVDHPEDCSDSVAIHSTEMKKKLKDSKKGGTNPECIVNDVKPAPNFSLNKMLGTWYTLASSIQYPVEPPVMLRVSLGQKNLLHVRILNHLLHEKEKCTSADILLSPTCGTADGDFFSTHSRITSPSAKWTAMKVLYLSDTAAAIYQCLVEKPDGSCMPGGAVGHILTRDLSVPLEEGVYLKLLLQKACVSPAHWKPTADHCTDLQNLMSEPGPESKTDENPECQALNIPAHPDIDFARLAGTWYEMAKTYTDEFNWDSAMKYFESAGDGKWKLTYIGQSSNTTECVTPPIRGLVKNRCPSDTYQGSLVKILDPRVWQFAVWQVLYTDYENTAVFYFCSNVDDLGHCVPEHKSISIMKKSKYLEPDWREKYDYLFTRACIDPQTVTETFHKGDCSSDLKTVVGQADKKKDCKVDDIQLASNFSNSKFLGLWYSVATNYQRPIKPPVVIRISQREGEELFHMRAILQLPQKNDSCEVTDLILIPRCGEDGDLFTTHSKGTSPKSLFTTLKVLYLTDTVAAVYHCVYEKPDGTCHPSAVISHILSRDPSVPIEEEGYLKNLLQQSGISVDHWKPVTDHCTDLQEVMSESGPESNTEERQPECQAFPAQFQSNLDLPRLEGYWFSVASTVNSKMHLSSFVEYLWVDDNGFLKFKTATTNADAACLVSDHGFIRPRCRYADNNQHVYKLITPGSWQFTPWVILYTDYDNTLVLYTCGNVDGLGQCVPDDRYVFIMSRSRVLEADWQNRYDQIFRDACIEPTSVQEMETDEHCTGELEAALDKMKVKKEMKKTTAVKRDVIVVSVNKDTIHSGHETMSDTIPVIVEK